MSAQHYLRIAAEGSLDEQVAVRVLELTGLHPHRIYGGQGKAHLREKIAAYNASANHSPWLILVDLDDDAPCAPALRDAWVPAPSPHLCFRVAVREVEAWLLADRDAIASFLGVASTRIPRDPETLADPKQEMVNLARNSRKRDIREDLVPTPEARRAVGAAYPSRLGEFASTEWDPRRAAAGAPSLARCLAALERMR